MNRHLPPLLPNKFDLYSYQRGAFIHFHPSSCKLNYFPVIFDHAVLLLKMDDRENNNNMYTYSSTYNHSKLGKTYTSSKRFSLKNFLSSKPQTTVISSQKWPASSTTITCLTVLKRIFCQSSTDSMNTTKN